MVARSIKFGRAARLIARLAFCALVGAGAMLVWALGSAAVARADSPAYDEMPVNPPSVRGWTKAKNYPGDVRLMLHGDAGFDQASFDAYFNNVLFPQFTLYKEPGNVFIMATDVKDKSVTWRQSNLPFCREDFLKTFVLQANQNGDSGPFNHLNDLTVQAMRTIALGNYHPLARYNAAILLGSLYQYKQIDNPLPSALPALMACLDANSDLVRVAALQGILKQVKAKTDGQAHGQIIAAMLKIVGEKAPPAGRTAEGHDWMRRRAIDVLGAAGEQGANLSVVAALNAILLDSQSSIDISCAAAKALGNIAFRAPDDMNASATAYSIGQVALDTCKIELDQAAKRHDATAMAQAAAANNVAQQAGGIYFNRQEGQAPAADHNLYIPVQLLRSEFYELDLGLKGTQPQKGLIAAVTGTKHQAFVTSVEQNLNALMMACDPKAADYDTLKAQIEKAESGLETALAASGVQGRAANVEKTIGVAKPDALGTAPEKPAAPATAPPGAFPPAAK